MYIVKYCNICWMLITGFNVAERVEDLIFSDCGRE